MLHKLRASSVIAFPARSEIVHYRLDCIMMPRNFSFIHNVCLFLNIEYILNTTPDFFMAALGTISERRLQYLNQINFRLKQKHVAQKIRSSKLYFL